MFIKYNNSNIHALAHIDQDEKRIAGGPQNIYWLRPGWNEFPSLVWKMYENHPEITKMIKEKKIELLNEKVTVVKGKKKTVMVIGMNDEPVNLMDFQEDRAVEICKGTLNRDILNRWLDDETRNKVKKALELQIKPLLPENQHKAS